MNLEPSNPVTRRVALIGWDGADWQMIHPLLDAGLLPNLQKLIERGVMGNVATLKPVISPLLWNSIATGKTADVHGVLGFVEPDPVGGALRPVTSTARKTKAIWNMLHQAGLHSLVLNWYAGHPAEPIRGACVSDIFAKTTGRPWSPPPASVYPEELTATLAEFRVGARDLTGDDLAPFIPRLNEIDQGKDKRPLKLALQLAETISIQGAATWLMENRPWDFMAVYFDLIDKGGHDFMPFHPPRMEHIAERDFELYSEVVKGLYCFQDLLLGRMVQLAGPDSTIILLSDHGFQSGPSRPVNATHPAAPLEWHRSHGILVMAGPGIRQDELVYGAGLLDITPTVLTLFGLPCGADMRGKVLASAFVEPVAITKIPSWDEVPGDCGMHKTVSDDVWEASAIIDQLAALGYIDTVDKNSSEMRHIAELDRKATLANVHMANGDFETPIESLRELVRDRPEQIRYSLRLAQCYYKTGRLADCRSVVLGLLAAQQAKPVVRLLKANLAMAEGNIQEGLDHLLDMERAGHSSTGLLLVIGRLYGMQKRWDDAERSFRAMIELDADSADGRAGLARCLLEKGRLREAADAAMDAIGLNFELPGAHFVLGVALARLGRIERAIQALEACLILAPGNAAAHTWLALIHEQATRDPFLAAEHRAAARSASAA